MTGPSPHASISGLLQALERGDRTALDALFPLVYDELRSIAHRQRERWHGDLTLNTTALVHEAYLKLADQQRINVSDRAHFFAVAATVMRHVLCNYARDRRRQKRGGDLEQVSLEHADVIGRAIQLSDDQTELLVLLGDSLQRLEHMNKRRSQVIECRFFAGLSVEETASALHTSAATVKRDWMLARAWLYREMQLEVGPVE